jgi:hypothetical protein
MSDLIKRLRYDSPTYGTNEEAADEITRLRAELDAQCEKFRIESELREYWGEQWEAKYAECAALRAELDALKSSPVPTCWAQVDDDGKPIGVLDFENPPYYSTPLYAAPVPSIPEGYQLVPVEPTREMKMAGLHADIPVSLSFTEVTAIYKAMIAAAKEET